MKNRLRSLCIVLFTLWMVLGAFFGCSFSIEEDDVQVGNSYIQEENADIQVDNSNVQVDSEAIDEDGEYTSKEEVALYIHTYGELPDNFITKNEARELGWDNSKGNLWDVAPGKSIGGDKFGNYEGLLPEEDGLKYYECDINYEGGYRGAERIIFSNQGDVYYTEDHYESFTQLYEGEE